MWRALGGVQYGDAAAGASADIDEATTAANGFNNGVNGARDGGEAATDGDRHFAVFAIHQLHNLQRAQTVKIFRRRIAQFTAPLSLGCEATFEL